MRWLRIFVAITSTVLLEGCYALAFYNLATADQSWGIKTIDVPYDKQTQARVRVVGIVGKMAKNSTCHAESPVSIEKVAGSLSMGWRIMSTGTLPDSLKSVSIGMPRLQKAGHFEEDVVPANVPIAVKTSIIIDYRESFAGSDPFGKPQKIVEIKECTPPPVYFIPKAGRDYEVNIRKIDATRCEVYLHRLDGAEEIEMDRLPLFAGEKCNT